MARNKNFVKKEITKRVMAGVLSFALLFGLAPAVTPAAQAASWMDPYVETAVDWGIMKGDENGNLNAEKELTRAEFVAMMNRAFGYTEVGPTPFTDVPQDAWYAEDIAIAYNAGYFKGTGATTAEPNSKLTREQTAVLIGRNLRLQGGTGENMSFIDNRDISTWSRGLVEESVKLGIIQGDDNGAFLPKDNVLRGQVACMLVRALGTLINDSGEQKLGSVYGNLAINTSGVTLKDTVVTGNLYLTGGVGLGDIELENVTVYGKIVVAGSGESTSGDHSVVLRNVDAQALEVDSISNQFLTVSAEGLTNIADTTVRTQAYLQDLTRDGLGLKNIEFDAAAGAQLQLAGNIKQLINKTPGSLVNFGQGVAHNVTVDEKAIGSVVNVDGAANLKELNLDVGTEVTGSGDVDHLNVNAAGSSVVMLPDTITIRPGLTADIYEEEMDTTAAEESSADPRILTGYPEARKIAAKSAEVAFSTNKKGTLYWGLTALSDGSLSEAELVNPTTTPAKIIKSGTIEMEASNTEELAKLSGLTKDGSYYVSAVLVDNRGMRSPVKVEAFTTPDDTTPAFTSGYPKALVAEDEEENQIIQAQVMANKDCLMYYALMPQGASAPTVADFKAAALSGNLGHGVEELKKNTPWLVSQINTAHLKEQTTYDLYLWLTDADGAKSSAIKKLSITTPDKTPPIIQHMTLSTAAAKSITMTYAADEPGTLYWAVVKSGAGFYNISDSYTKVETDNDGNTVTDDDGKPVYRLYTEEEYMELDVAKIQLINGIGALKSGKSNASKALTDVKFTISGLESERSYDLYYVFVDKAGNYSEYGQTTLEHPMTVATLDDTAPTVTQEFTKPGSSDGKNLTPYPDTSIQLIFSENVEGLSETETGGVERSLFLDLYKSGDKDALAAALEKHITLYYESTTGFKEVTVRNKDNPDSTDWVIDYRKTTVELDVETGKLALTFPYSEDETESGLNLASGETYYFELNGIADTSSSENLMVGTKGTKILLKEFTTVFATVNLAIGTNSGTITVGGSTVDVDVNFTAIPVATEKVADGTKWDMLLWTNAVMSYSVYGRTWAEKDDDCGEWKLLGSAKIDNIDGISDGKIYESLTKLPGDTAYGELNELGPMEYAISITSIENNSERASWNKEITVGVTVIAGTNYSVNTASKNGRGTTDTLDTAKEAGAVSIGVKDPFEVLATFTDKTSPEISSLQVVSGDIGATINVTLDRAGTVYYIVAPVANWPVQTKKNDANKSVPDVTSNTTASKTGEVTRADGDNPIDQDDLLALSLPYTSTVTGGNVKTSGVFTGNTGQIIGGVTNEISLTGLESNTVYMLYVVTKGLSAQSYSGYTLCCTFITKEAERPIINVTRYNEATAKIEVNKSSYLDYALVLSTSLQGTAFSEAFSKYANSAWNGTTDVAGDEKDYSDVTTVLDAMATDHKDEDENVTGSVFDYYATESAKTYFASLIRSTVNDNAFAPVMMENTAEFIVPTGKNSYTETVTMTGMEGIKNYYTLLVVGHTVNSSGDAFRASRPYFNKDSSYLTVSTSLVGQGSSSGNSYTGTLVLNFSDKLYYKDSDGVDQQIYKIDYCPRVETTHALKTFADDYCKVGMAYDVTTSGGSVTLQNESTSNHKTWVGSTLKFTLTAVGAGTTFTIYKEVCGENGNTHTKDLKITLKKSAVVADSSTTYEWYLEVTPSDWVTG